VYLWNNRLLSENMIIRNDIDYLLIVTTSHPRRLEISWIKKNKMHPCTGTEALYRPYGPEGE